MVSGKSCSKGWFNTTLFWKNIRRFWPLWLGISLAWFLLLPANLMDLFAHREVNPTVLRDTVLQFTYVALFLGGATGLAASLCVFQPLFSQKATFAFHALPLRREGLWLTNCLSGLVVALIPAAANALLLILTETGSTPGLDWYGIGALTAVLAASTFFGFALGALCASVTGNLPTAVVFFVLANCAVWLGWALLCTLIEPFAKGIVFNSTPDWLTWVTPLWKLIEDCGEIYDEGTLTSVVQNLWVYGLYAGVGVLFLLAGGSLYHFRGSEHAGDVIAFRWLRPLFAIGLSLGVGVGLTVCLMDLYAFGNSSLALALVLLAVGTFIGWLAARMLLKKSFRVFDKATFLGWGILFAVLALVLGAVRVDALGIQRRVPEVNEVESVQVSAVSGTWQTDPEQAIALHQTLVDYDGEADSYWVEFTYTLKDGSTLTRGYRAPDQEQDPELYALFMDLVLAPDAVWKRTLPDTLREDPDSLTMIVLHQQLSQAVSYYDDPYDTYETETTYYGEEAQAILEALVQDIQAGNYSDIMWVVDDDYYDAEYANAWLEIFYRETYPDVTHDQNTLYLDLYNCMANTFEALWGTEG